MDDTGTIIKRHRGDLTQDVYADILSDSFHPYRKIRRQHISMWERGANRPDLFAMIYLRDYGSPSVRRMAIEVINAIQNEA